MDINKTALNVEIRNKVRPYHVVVATFIALIVIILGSPSAQATWERTYHNDFNYANAVRGSGPIGTLSGGSSFVGYSTPGGWFTASYGGTYNYLNGNAYMVGQADGDSWSNYSHLPYGYGESKCWWNTSYPASHNPLLICRQLVE